MSKKKTKPKKTVINGVAVDDLIQWIKQRRDACREYKNNIPKRFASGLAYTSSASTVGSNNYADYLLDLEAWAIGTRKYPVNMTDTEGKATGENHIGTVMDTISADLAEKNFNIEHRPEGPEDPDDLVNKINAVRSLQWDTDGCSDLIRDMAESVKWRGLRTAAVHQYYYNEKPVGQKRVIDIDPLAFDWDIFADKIEKSDFFDYSETLPIKEIEEEWQVKLEESNLDIDDEADYSLTAYRVKKDSGSSNDQKAQYLSLTGKQRIHYCWIYDTTEGVKEIADYKVVEVPVNEEVQRPAMNEAGEPLTPEEAGVDETAEVFSIDGMPVYKEQVQINDVDGNPQTATLLEVQKVNRKKYRKYPNGRLVVYVGEQILFDGPNPYQMDFLTLRDDQLMFPVPIFWMYAYKIPGHVEGMSYIEAMLEDQMSINIRDNQIRMNTRLNGNGILVTEEGAMVLPKDTKDIDTSNPQNVFMMKKGRLEALKWLKAESLSAQAIQEKQAKIEHLRDRVGVNDVRVKGETVASDPAQKTEFLTGFSQRRQSPMFRSIQAGVIRYEEIRLSLYKQFDHVPTNHAISIKGTVQNVEFKPEMLKNYKAHVVMKVVDSDDTRQAKEAAQLARTIEQAGATIAEFAPNIVGGMVMLMLEAMHLPGIEEATKKYEELATQPTPEGGDNIQGLPDTAVA